MKIIPLLVLVCFNKCFAQLPDTELWLFEIKNLKGNLLLAKGENITSRPGYDNQPFFAPDEKSIYYVSIREDKQADIYRYFINKKKTEQITKTIESEYSPVVLTASKRLNCVVVEKDSAQKIWQYDEISGEPKKVLFEEDSIGYYHFLNTDTVLYYKLTEPHSLRARSLSEGTDVFIAANIVRGFKGTSRFEFVFGVKDSSKVIFYKYNALTRKAVKYCESKSLSEDIVWHKVWGLLKSEKAIILRYDEKSETWLPIFDFSAFGIKKISRFIFDDKNKKVVVVESKS
jgi:hypothetical protein